MKKSLKKVYYFFDKIYSYFYIKWKLKKLQKLNLKIKIIIGASSTKYRGWIKTNFYSLNLLKISTFENFFNFNEIDIILTEHVLEHLTKEEAKLAMNNCYKYLKKDGFIRIAVPDGNFKNQKYLDSVKPGGTGPGAQDHKVLYNFETIKGKVYIAGISSRPKQLQEIISAIKTIKGVKEIVNYVTLKE